MAMSALTTVTRASASRAGPCGTVPLRIHSMSGSSISTTAARSTRGSASTRCSVKPSPSPPTSTAFGSSTRSRAWAASSISLVVSRVSITKTPLTRSSTTSAAVSDVRRRSTTSPRSVSARAISTLSTSPSCPLGCAHAVAGGGRQDAALALRTNRRTARGPALVDRARRRRRRRTVRPGRTAPRRGQDDAPGLAEVAGRAPAGPRPRARAAGPPGRPSAARPGARGLALASSARADHLRRAVLASVPSSSASVAVPSRTTPRCSPATIRSPWPLFSAWCGWVSSPSESGTGFAGGAHRQAAARPSRTPFICQPAALLTRASG